MSDLKEKMPLEDRAEAVLVVMKDGSILTCFGDGADRYWHWVGYCVAFAVANGHTYPGPFPKRQKP